MPNPILIGLIIAVAFLALATFELLAVLRARRGVYYPRPALFTPAEHSFLRVLEQVLLPGVRVVRPEWLSEDLPKAKHVLTNAQIDLIAR